MIGTALLAIDTGQDVIAKPVGGAEQTGREHTAAERCAPGSDANGRGVVAGEQLVVFDLLGSSRRRDFPTRKVSAAE